MDIAKGWSDQNQRNVASSGHIPTSETNKSEKLRHDRSARNLIGKWIQQPNDTNSLKRLQSRVIQNERHGSTGEHLTSSRIA
eukprot:5158640-Amphidinium_carterae.1